MTAAKRPGKRRSVIQGATTATSSVIAAGSVLALLANPALAIELGELQVESSLGQPLRASIAYALAPHEQITAKCVYLRAAAPGAGLPTITRATTTLSGNRIVLQGSTPLREPMMNLQVAVDCAYTARLRRDYLVLLDPPSLRERQTASVPAVAVRPDPAAQSVAANRSRRAAAPRRSAVATAPVEAGSRYQVQPGDTLSEIVSRIENRKVALWPAVNAIHAANQDAFLNGDVNRLIAGSTLTIPASVSATSPAIANQQARSPVAESAVDNATSPAATSRAYRGIAEGAAETVTAAEAPAPVVQMPVADAAVQQAAVEPAAASTGVESNASPFVDEAGSEPAIATPAATITIPDTRIEQRQPQPIAIGDTGAESPAQAWLVWLGGSGIALVLALLLFGRRLREKFGGAQSIDDLDETELNPALPMRRSTDFGNSEDTDSINLRDTLAKADPFEVQVNLDDGSGFDATSDVDVAEDYSFASSGEYSRDGIHVQAGGETDVIAAPVQENAIEVHEQAAPDEGTGYDMSMIVDVTKQDFGTAAETAKDLQAIEVTPLTVDPSQSGTMELTSEFDYEVLRQDYEDELTATQALDREVEKAAMELRDRLSEFDDDQSQVSMAEDLEGTAEVTAEMPKSREAENETLNELGLDETDISDDLTAVLPDSKDDSTVEMGADSDATVEQPRRSKAG